MLLVNHREREPRLHAGAMMPMKLVHVLLRAFIGTRHHDQARLRH
jgi:hypothetical protein